MDLLANTPRDEKKEQEEEMKSPQVQELEQESEENLKTLVKEGLRLDKIGKLESNGSDDVDGLTGPFKQKAIIQ